MNASRIYYEDSQPILRVENMEAALRFYVDMLGFSNARWGTDEFTSVNRDRPESIFLEAARAAARLGFGSAWTTSNHLRRFEDRGVPVRMPPTNLSLGSGDAGRRS